MDACYCSVPLLTHHYLKANSMAAPRNEYLRPQFVRAMTLAAEHSAELERVVTHRFPLEGLVDAIETTKRGEGLKSVIRFE